MLVFPWSDIGDPRSSLHGTARKSDGTDPRAVRALSSLGITHGRVSAAALRRHLGNHPLHEVRDVAGLEPHPARAGEVRDESLAAQDRRLPAASFPYAVPHRL